MRKDVQKALDAMIDKVLAYRPEKPANAKKRRTKSARKASAKRKRS